MYNCTTCSLYTNCNMSIYAQLYNTIDWYVHCALLLLSDTYMVDTTVALFVICDWRATHNNRGKHCQQTVPVIIVLLVQWRNLLIKDALVLVQLFRGHKCIVNKHLWPQKCLLDGGDFYCVFYSECLYQRLTVLTVLLLPVQSCWQCFPLLLWVALQSQITNRATANQPCINH